ncbi:hypothetical protein L0244_01265, partial [bacterium]|nr:hypothetical protein [bacterium]
MTSDLTTKDTKLHEGLTKILIGLRDYSCPALKIDDRPSSPPYEGGDKGEVGNILKTPTPSL